VTLATHSRRPRLQKAEARAEIQRPPPTPALALVIARAAPPATGTAIAVPGARADRHHQRPVRLEFYLFDHNSVQSEQRLSYPQWAHVAVLSRGVPDLEAGNPMSAAACAPSQPPSGRPCAPTSLPQSADRRRCQAAITTCKPTQRLAHPDQLPSRCLTDDGWPRYTSAAFTSPTERAGAPKKAGHAMVCATASVRLRSPLSDRVRYCWRRRRGRRSRPACRGLRRSHRRSGHAHGTAIAGPRPGQSGRAAALDRMEGPIAAGH
jgi:hypothetical protein